MAGHSYERVLYVARCKHMDIHQVGLLVYTLIVLLEYINVQLNDGLDL